MAVLTKSNIPAMLIAVSIMSAPAFAIADETAPPAPPAATEVTPAPATPVQTSDQSDEDQKVVCKKIDAPVGSRIGAKKVCHTVADWRRMQERSKEITDESQSKGSTWNPPGG